MVCPDSRNLFCLDVYMTENYFLMAGLSQKISKTIQGSDKMLNVIINLPHNDHP